MMHDALTVILAGGIGSRLSPLTDHRTKPAVPFGGKYRIIDFTLTNCLHSGLRRILVLTQYKSHSLQKHLRDGWSIFNPELGEYVTNVPPQMRNGDSWYTGTADAIYQNLYLLKRSEAKYVVVLSGDHIYRMDYAPMIERHKETGADVTIASMRVDREEAKHFGVMQIDDNHRILTFCEKPENPTPLLEDSTKSLASMGIYIFTTKALIDALEHDSLQENSSHDFGKDIIPRLIDQGQVYTHQFGGKEGRVSQDAYWRDVGTLDSYYQANMDLLQPTPPMNLYQQDWAIRTYEPQLPPARTVSSVTGNEGIFINSIIANGVVSTGGSVQKSILFPKVTIKNAAVVVNSIIFEGVTIEDNAYVQNCIIDKHVTIPAGMEIGVDPKLDAIRFKISDKGVVIIPSDYNFKSCLVS